VCWVLHSTTTSGTVHKYVGLISPMYSYHITLVFSLSDGARTGKIPVPYYKLAPFGAALLVVPIHVPLGTRHVAGLGPFGSGPAYDIAGFPSHANGPSRFLQPSTARVILQIVITHGRLPLPVALTLSASLFANLYAQGLGGSRLQQ